MKSFMDENGRLRFVVCSTAWDNRDAYLAAFAAPRIFRNRICCTPRPLVQCFDKGRALRRGSCAWRECDFSEIAPRGRPEGCTRVLRRMGSSLKDAPRVLRAGRSLHGLVSKG